ncbi:MAG: ZIP family metal transporter [Clostridia bacterium]|nr:ZIP family metal transporter [Clostridia bacterium]
MDNNLLVFLGILFIFLMTTLGSSLVFLFKGRISPKWNVIILGFASGIMISASIWSLLMPAIEQAESLYSIPIMPISIGFLIGGLFLSVLELIICPPKIKREKSNLNSCGEDTSFEIQENIANGIKIKTNEENVIKQNLNSKGQKRQKSINKSTRLFLAVTIHNIPEGLAVGLAFGGAIIIGDTSAYISALMLAFGIGIQNFPEGMAVTLPLKNAYGNNKKAFCLGVISGVVEPIFALVGILLASILPSIMPWLLAFSAGAMLFVVAQDLIPDSKSDKYFHLGAWGVIIGFVIMMILDISLA